MAAPDVEDLLERGKQALTARRGAEARTLFLEGRKWAKTEPMRWQMQLGLALALVVEEDLVAAAHAYRAFLRASDDHPAATSDKWQRRRQRAAEDLKNLERKLLANHARVDIQSEPPTANVAIDGRLATSATPTVVYLTPGSHNVTLELPGHQTESLALVVEPGQQALIHRKLAEVVDEAAGPSPTRSPSTRPPPKEAPPDEGVSWVPGAVTLASGAALLLGAGILHGSALRDADQVRQLQAATPVTDDAAVANRDAELRNRIDDYQKAYVTLYVAGGAAAVAGVALLVYDAVATESTSEAPSLSVWVAPAAAGLGWRGRF